MDSKEKKFKHFIIILSVLLLISASTLAAVLLHSRFAHAESTTVSVPGDILSPYRDNSTDLKSETSSSAPSEAPQTQPSAAPEPSTDPEPSEATMPAPSEAPQTQPTAEPEPSADPEPSKSTIPNPAIGDPSSPPQPYVPPAGAANAATLSLHTRQPEENKTFQTENMFPGDSETKYYRIKASYKGNIIIRYHADIHPGYEQLAAVLKVKVRLHGADGFLREGVTLYDGPMSDMPKSLNQTLHTNQSTQSELYYEITAYLDTSVGNEYQNQELKADFRWWVEERDNLTPPKTGDRSHIQLWIALACGSLICMIILFAKRRKEAADAH